MSNSNWAGIILTIVITFFLIGFIASKIPIYDGTAIDVPTSGSLWDLLFAPVSNFFDSINPFKISF